MGYKNKKSRFCLKRFLRKKSNLLIIGLLVMAAYYYLINENPDMITNLGKL